MTMQISAPDLRQQVRAATDPGGLRISDTTVEGELDLSAFELAAPLVFERCHFDTAPNLEGADLHSVKFVDCTLPGLLANGVRVRRDVDLSGSVIRGAHRTDVSRTHTAAVWLCESSIGGRLLCVGTTLDGAGDRALHADRIEIGGSVRFMEGFRSSGELRLIGAQVAGSVEIYSVRLVNPGGPALRLDSADIKAALFIQGRRTAPSLVEGRIGLGNVHVTGDCVLRDIEVRGDGVAIAGSRLTVGGQLLVDAGTVVVGELSLPAADLGGFVVASGAGFASPGAAALDLTNADIRSQCRFAEGLTVHGRIRLPRAHIRGRLLMRGVHLDGPQDGVLLDAYGLFVEGNVELRDLVADGGRLVFNNLSCRRLGLRSASVRVTEGTALDLGNAVLLADLDLGSFTGQGGIRLSGAEVTGWLDCHDAVIRRAPGPADRPHTLSAVSATFGQGMNLTWAECDGVDLDGVTTSTLVLEPADWPAGFRVAGLTYERIGSERGQLRGGRAVPDWLDRAEFDAGAYEHAARVFRRHGYGAQAEHLLIRGRDQAGRLGLRNDLREGTWFRRLVAPGRRGLDWLYGRTVGYGYRPGRALIALILLLVAVLGVLSFPAAADTFRATDARGEVYTVGDDCADGHVRCFRPVFYAVDTVVPLVSLNQRSTWYPDAHLRRGGLLDVGLNVATLLGWILSTIVVLSFARLARTT
jgi:hypothetical protein